MRIAPKERGEKEKPPKKRGGGEKGRGRGGEKGGKRGKETMGEGHAG